MAERKLTMHRQPTETSCGPTCLQALYQYYGYTCELETIIKDVTALPTGGTLAVHLGKHALKNGFEACIFTYNITVFDPTWFHPKKLSTKQLIEKLQVQSRIKQNRRIVSACGAYVRFLKSGGQVVMKDLSPELIRHHLEEGHPILTGLSSTYLYQTMREYVVKHRQVADDIIGTPEGHFVIIEKYNPQTQQVTIADPYAMNPYSINLRYQVPIERLITAMLLGVLTYDANFLLVRPKRN